MIVTLEHVVLAPGSPLLQSWQYGALFAGTGVDLFFVLSGYLITHLLLKEMREVGTVSLRRFYARRALRLLPAYFLLLSTVAILVSTGLLAIDRQAWVPAITYTYNLMPGRHEPTLGHIWSLCVEEHFYLVWPVILAILGRGIGLWFLIAAIVSAPVLRFAIWQSPVDIDFFTLTRMDTLAVGCLLAYYFQSRRSTWAIQRAKGFGTWLAILAVFVLVVSVSVLTPMSGAYTLGVKRGIEAMASALLIFSVITNPGCLFGRIVNSKAFVVTGMLSYSLYMAQTFSVATKSSSWPLPWIWNLPLVIAYAFISYVLVERPFLLIKARLARRSRPKKTTSNMVEHSANTYISARDSVNCHVIRQ